MKFEEISAPHLSIRVKPKTQLESLSEGDVLSIKNTLARGEFEIATQNSVINVIPVNNADRNILSDQISTGRAMLAKLTDVAPDGSAELQIFTFNGEKLEMGELEIGIDERACKFLQRNTPDEAARVLWGQSVLKHGGKNYFFIVAGEAAKTYLETRDPIREKTASDNLESMEIARDNETELADTLYNEFANQDSGSKNRHFAILGADLRFALAEKNKGTGESIFLASKITRVRNHYEDPALFLACGNLKFIDWTAAGERSVLAKIQLDKLTQSSDSYLKKWDQFADLEGELFLEHARNLGIISFSIKDEHKDGTTTVRCSIFSEMQKEALSELKEIDIVDGENIPAFLKDSNMTFTDFVRGIEDDSFSESLGIKKRKKQRILSTTVKIDSVNFSTSEMRLITTNFPPGDFIIYPVRGEITQITRRMNARRTIQTGRAANPHIGLLIEENGQIPPCLPPPKIKACSYEVMRKVFPKNPPTLAQEHAIEVALNTPDIALIQGPPGTGKTTVIAAIIERLNQESDKRSGINGRVLLSGFQHDAVENMIGRMTINGLPVPKFGHRSGEEESADLKRFEQRLQEWREDRANAMRAKNPLIAESIQEQHLRNACVKYIHAPTLSFAISLLENALVLPDTTLGHDLREKIQKEIKYLKAEQHNEFPENSKVDIVRRIRISPQGFSDDGSERASDVLFELKDELSSSDKDILLQASRWFIKDKNPPFLSKLKELKGRLLVQLTPAPIFRAEKPREIVISLIHETLNQIRANGLSARDKKTAALADLVFEMENNASEILDTITDYSFAFAATCQQSVNKAMQDLKGISPDAVNQQMEYDYVIVDEAARVSPRDLMIPMAQGKRIILVGDHRQLPQLIDDEIAKRLEKNTECDSENEWLKKSMFEYLFTDRLPKLESADGITRRVTLDKQFRMHPLLGDFISRNFYGSEEQFTSGLPENIFAYDLPHTSGKCAIWIDVPFEKGRMIKEDKSQIRPAEAEIICDRLQEWIDYDDRRTDDPKKKLSFGVISFYKAQTELIKRKLGAKFIDSVGEKRLRIGTVDSFQGMEFDVVFLSLVRTGSKGFGFLRLSNRLNVSMSRQKKLLVTVGDAMFYSSQEAQNSVPGLADFLKLCREKGEIL